MECGLIQCGENPDLLVKIKLLFSESAQMEFTRRRYGMKGCKNTYDFTYLQDLTEIYKRTLDMKACDPIQDLDNACGCNLAAIEETIKTI